jgi:hypothetical protein
MLVLIAFAIFSGLAFYVSETFNLIERDLEDY